MRWACPSSPNIAHKTHCSSSCRWQRPTIARISSGLIHNGFKEVSPLTALVPAPAKAGDSGGCSDDGRTGSDPPWDLRLESALATSDPFASAIASVWLVSTQKGEGEASCASVSGSRRANRRDGDDDDDDDLVDAARSWPSPSPPPWPWPGSQFSSRLLWLCE